MFRNRRVSEKNDRIIKPSNSFLKMPNILSKIPNELIYKISHLLDYKSLFQLHLINKLMYKINVIRIGYDHILFQSLLCDHKDNWVKDQSIHNYYKLNDYLKDLNIFNNTSIVKRQYIYKSYNIKILNILTSNRSIIDRVHIFNEQNHINQVKCDPIYKLPLVIKRRLLREKRYTILALIN